MKQTTINNQESMRKVQEQIAALTPPEKEMFNAAFLDLQGMLNLYGTYGYMALGFMALKMALELEGDTIELDVTPELTDKGT